MTRSKLNETLPRVSHILHRSFVAVRILLTFHWAHRSIFGTCKLNARQTLTLSKHISAANYTSCPFILFLIFVEPHLSKIRIVSYLVLHFAQSIDLLGRWISFERSKVATLAWLKRVVVACSLVNLRMLLKRTTVTSSPSLFRGVLMHRVNKLSELACCTHSLSLLSLAADVYIVQSMLFLHIESILQLDLVNVFLNIARAGLVLLIGS